MLTFERVEATSTTWFDEVKSYDSYTVYQSPAWLSFVSDAQNAEAVVAALKQGRETVGWFVGLMVKKWGLRLLGSPFPGWTTSYMGLCLRSHIARVAAITALRRFAFEELGCLHLEMMDRNLTFTEVDQLGFAHRSYNGYQVNLMPAEDEIFAKMSKRSCQWCIRKAKKTGVIVEEAHDDAFATDYCSQLADVFAKQFLVTTYGSERVRKLIKHVHPTGMLLLLRARAPDGRCIATGIFPAANKTMYFWGGASWREFQSLCPNEMLHWYAMRYWKRRGIHSYDMGGSGDYKRKYGGSQIAVPWFRTSKYPWISPFRELARGVVGYRQKLFGKAQSFMLKNPQK